MPDADGKLSDIEIEGIRAHLLKTRPPPALPFHCPYCDHDEWSLGGHILWDPITPNKMGPDVKMVPYVAMFCKRCAFSVRFNAAMMGLYPALPTRPMPTPPQTAAPEQA